VTGVGHETDFTIVDFVSDARAPTPSAAAELVTPDKRDMMEQLGRTTEMLDGLAFDTILTLGNALDRNKRTLEYLSPANSVRTFRQRVDDYNGRMARQQSARVTLLQERLKARHGALRAADPRALLSRGYAIVTRRVDGQRVVSELDVKPGITLNIQLRDGEVVARVEDKDDHERHQPTLF